ncbi:MAG: metallophosphoesterase [Candidatus Gastranaerophilales bacterium]|nr:metallophosphoesterase [Candidatus Gastranaerophilales bacterium]
MKNKITKIFVILGLIIATTIGCYAFSFRNMTLDFIHITDTHITDRASTSYKALGHSKELLVDAVEQINDLIGLDFVMFTGDMVDSATDENFYNFYNILSKLKYPSLNTFGNHEYYGDMTREQVLDVIKGYNPNYIFNDTYYAFTPKSDYRIVVLDANIENNKTSMGEISQQQLQFLDKELFENQDKVVVIAMHHAPVEPFIAKEHSIANAKEMTDILAKYNNPIIVLSGHYHAAKIRRIGNLVFVSTPSTVTYPMAFRHIKITNYKDRVVYDFDFMETRLEDIKEMNRQSVISYGTLAGLEKDRNTQFIFHKKKHKSIRYKKGKIKNIEKESKTSKKEIQKLTKPKKVKKQKKNKKEKVVAPQEI